MISIGLALLFFHTTIFTSIHLKTFLNRCNICYGLMAAKLQLQTSWGQDPPPKLFVISNSDIYSRTVLQPSKAFRDKVYKVMKEQSHPKRDSEVWKCFSASLSWSFFLRSDFRIACFFLSEWQSCSPYHFDLFLNFLHFYAIPIYLKLFLCSIPLCCCRMLNSCLEANEDFVSWVWVLTVAGNSSGWTLG